jgi:hypothetical protein
VRALWAMTVLALAGCYVPRDSAVVEDRSCVKCHGDATREGTALQKAAPPFDVNGNTGVEYPGVGAHQLHLGKSATHGEVACTECHKVPLTAMDEGHNVGKTTFAFGPVALGEKGLASYEFDTRTCTNACHGERSGVWTAPRADACGTCHGVPPPSPHPQAGACGVCHADVIALDGGFIAPELHVNGVKNVSVVACNACHGTTDGGAPPRALDGSTERTSVGVGAHAAHVNGGAKTRPVACATCHEVPSMVSTPKHPNGGRAEVLASVRWSPATNTCTTNCHGGTSPLWTTPDAGLTCSSCHGAPPALPHPQATNCANCHPNSTGVNGRDVVNRDLHINGLVDVNVPTTCDGCHGSSTNFAPPRDTNGNTATTNLGVGAHQSHLVGRGLARVVLCTECHEVPAMVVAPNHLNGVTEVKFSGVATSNVALPTYAAGTCASAACHDIANLTGADGGGTATTPRWNLVDGSQITCTSCHGFPPPLPHPQQTACEVCHTNATDQRTFRRPELHVNGTVDFVTP